MKRIVFVAPGALPPLTEGRKLFVVDLAKTLRDRGLEVDVLDGEPADSPLRMILRSLRTLKSKIRTDAPPDAVVVFPYGTFKGIRKWANFWFLQRAQTLCSVAGVPMLPVLYSCIGLELDEFGDRFGPALAVGRGGQGVGEMHLGNSRAAKSWSPTGTGLKRVLFLCGYQNPTSKGFDDVLYERGLIDLFVAGPKLAAEGIQLTVATPFLRHEEMRKRLRQKAMELCPTLKVEMFAEVDPIELLYSHDAFVFPYRSTGSAFIPTSLLEAMSLGIPVVAADHRMYRALMAPSDEARGGVYRVADADDLVRVLLSMRQHYSAAVERAQRASIDVNREWTFEHCADELLTALVSLREKALIFR